MNKRNPKIDGSNIWACRPQTGPCPLDCNQCFYNRDEGEAFYCDINEPWIPDPKDVGNHGIVRFNDGHDSNIKKQLVIETSKKYRHFFFNTSLPNLTDFPGPCVVTINRDEKKPGLTPDSFSPTELQKIMYVRIRVSSSNFEVIKPAFQEWVLSNIPVVLTYMAYYDEEEVPDKELYEEKVRHINSYWCPNRKLKGLMYKKYQDAAMDAKGFMGMHHVFMCGTLDSNQCSSCNNCENLYWNHFYGKRLETNSRS